MITLHDHLHAWSNDNPERRPVAAAVMAIAIGAERLAAIIAQGPLAGDLGRVIGPSADNDGQKELDRYANELFIDHLRSADVAAVASEEVADPIVLNRNGKVAVAIDPLDGSNNVDINAPMGTLFSILPNRSVQAPETSFLVSGAEQLAAGFVLYGPHTAMVLTLGEGTHIFTLDAHAGFFILTGESVRIPQGRFEYAINASNVRFWPLPIRAFVEECLAGSEGPRGVDYNTRWVGAVVSEAYRILLHGGIYLYPGDSRRGYERGRLRLLYEANPLAMLMLQAGGKASDGFSCILSMVPKTIHDRTPLIFGAPDKVARVMQLYTEGVPQAGQRPLFKTRGLFKS